MKKLILNMICAVLVLGLVTACSENDENEEVLQEEEVPLNAVSISHNYSTKGKWYENNDKLTVDFRITSYVSVSVNGYVFLDRIKMLVDGNVVDEVKYSGGMSFSYDLNNLEHGVHELSFVAVLDGDNYKETDKKLSSSSFYVVNEKPVFKIKGCCGVELRCLAENGEEFYHYFEAYSKNGTITLPETKIDWLASNGEYPEFDANINFYAYIDDETICDEVKIVKDEAYPFENVQKWPNPFSPALFEPFQIITDVTMVGKHEGLEFEDKVMVGFNVVM